MPENLSFENLREKYPVFCYDSFTYAVDDTFFKAKFRFTVGEDFVFEPTIEIPIKPFFSKKQLETEKLDLLVFHIGMIELISYWKATCSPRVLIKPYSLSEEQVDFFKKVYFYGLGEFFYLNSIQTDVYGFMQMEFPNKQRVGTPLFFDLNSTHCLVPIGGGKDSVVTLELLKESHYNITPFIVNPRGASLGCVERAGVDRSEIVELRRTIDPLLLALNKRGFLNGHTPFSALLAFVSLLASALSSSKYIVLSNESSANEPTVLGTGVNHQYSKSLEFESDFRQYVARYISDSFIYFSLLRPLSELQIAAQFSTYSQYWEVFKSCNVGSKTDIWCCHCPKCLFAYLILSPFIPQNQLEKIFSKNLLEDSQMQILLDQLIGKAKEKPFECVGTIEEVRAAMLLSKERIQKEKGTIPLLLRDYIYTDSDRVMAQNMLRDLNQEHFLEPSFIKLIRK